MAKTYRIKELVFSNGMSRYFPEYSEVSPKVLKYFKHTIVWNKCVDSNELGYKTFDECLEYINKDKLTEPLSVIDVNYMMV